MTEEPLHFTTNAHTHTRIENDNTTEKENQLSFSLFFRHLFICFLFEEGMDLFITKLKFNL